GDKRLASLPQVPTMAEFLPGYSIPVTYSAWVPAATPKAVADKLQADLQKVAALPEIAERLAAASVQVVGSNAEELLARTRAESARWKRLIEQRNIKADQ